MKHVQCGHHFCWLCLGPYAAHSEKTGGFYACNKFEKRLLTQGRTAEEKEVRKPLSFPSPSHLITSLTSPRKKFLKI